MRTIGKHVVMVTWESDHEFVDLTKEGASPVSGPTPNLPHDYLLVVPEEPDGG